MSLPTRITGRSLWAAVLVSVCPPQLPSASTKQHTAPSTSPARRTWERGEQQGRHLLKNLCFIGKLLVQTYWVKP